MFVIAGVSGRTGAVVAATLLSQGKPVRVVVRDAQKGEPWRARGAEVALATLQDAPALARALEGSSGAYFLYPGDFTARDPLAHSARVVDALVTAIEQSAVPHVVLLSSIGAQHAHGTGIVRTLHHAEQRLSRVHASTTFLRAGYFVENWMSALGALAQGVLPTFFSPERQIPMVATRDIGAVAARALLDGAPAGTHDVIELAGPREYSANDLAARFATAMHRPITVQPAPLDAVAPTFIGLGASPAVAELYRELYQGFADGHLAWHLDGTRFLRGRIEPESILTAHR